MPIPREDVSSILRFLSPERLAALTRLTGSNEDSIELHQDTLRLGASLMHVIATLEISLRNSICENLVQYFSVPNWLTQTPAQFHWREPECKKIQDAIDSARRAEYSKLTQDEKSSLDRIAYPDGRPPNTPHLKRSKDRRQRIAVSEGKVIAELTLYFWKRLYGPDYDQTLWRTTLKKTFPYKKLTRAEIAINLERIYQSRNRLAHHEQVLRKRFDDTMTSVRFVTLWLETSTASGDTPLSRLLENDIHLVEERAASLHARLDAYR